MIAPPTACSRSTAHVTRWTQRLGAASSWPGMGCYSSAWTLPAASSASRARGWAPPWQAGSTFRATRSATATSSPRAWPPAPRRAPLSLRTAVQRLETAGDRVTASSPTRAGSRRTIVVAMGSFTGPLLRGIGVDVPIYPVKGLSIPSRAAAGTAPRASTISSSAWCRLATGSASPARPRSPALTPLGGRPGARRSWPTPLDLSGVAACHFDRGTARFGRTASRHARRHADHWADQDRQCLGQCRSRPSRLDARLRLGACAR